jgi:phage baseplate assembly protein W
MRNTGWHFEGVGLSRIGGDTAVRLGPTVTAAGTIAMVSGDRAVRQAILMLLTTIPGERVMRPDYGCPLNRLAFAVNDATTAGLAIHYVRTALDLWEPRIDIVRLDAGSRSGEAGSDPYLVIALDYVVRATNTRDSIEMALNLMDEAA